MTELDRRDTAKAFAEAVNMTPAALQAWLKTEESRAVGWTGEANKHEAGGPESVGHHSGRRIVEIKHKPSAALTEADYEQMRMVVGFIHRHLAQRPAGDVTQTRWRYSLMNWGHDPLKSAGGK